MGHESSDALEYIVIFKHEGWECDPAEVHPDSKHGNIAKSAIYNESVSKFNQCKVENVYAVLRSEEDDDDRRSQSETNRLAGRMYEVMAKRKTDKIEVSSGLLPLQPRRSRSHSYCQ